jgi:hypothetical protein
MKSLSVFRLGQHLLCEMFVVKNNLKKTTRIRFSRVRVANWLRAYASPPYGITHTPLLKHMDGDNYRRCLVQGIDNK